MEKIIIDRNTSFLELMTYINSVVSPSERAARARRVCQKAPYLKQTMEIYFGDQVHSFSVLGSDIDEIVKEIKILGIKDYGNFGAFVRDLYLWTDSSPLPKHRLKSKLLGLLDYTIETDVEFITKLVKLEQIEEFNDFGLDAYNILMGK